MRTPCSGRMISVGVLISLVFVASGVCAKEDVVEYLVEEGKARQVIGHVIEERWDEVHIKTTEDGEEKVLTIESPRVQHLRYGETPHELATARVAFNGAKFNRAYELFTEAAEVAAQKKEHKWARPCAFYRAGEAAFNHARDMAVTQEEKERYFKLGLEQCDKLLDEFPEHRFAPDGKLLKAKCLMRLGRLDESEGLLQSLIDSEYYELTRLRARLWMGRLLGEKKEHDQAVEKLAALQKELKDSRPQLYYRARMEEAYARLASDDQRGAESILWEMSLRCDDPELRAEAAVSRGLSLKKRGQLREALYSFLRVVVLHFDVPDEYQKALYHAALVAREYYEDDQRAKELANELYEKFPQSHLTQELKKTGL